MYRKKLEHMKDTLMCAIECEMCNLEAANTAELGEAIDMVKDLSEAIYYATITEAMENGGEEKQRKSRMYYMDWHNDVDDEEDEDHSEWEGHSPKVRKMYLEAKAMNKDKATQLRELEKYMQELSQDIVEMINDATPEEKSYLEKKITALATKIGQMK